MTSDPGVVFDASALVAYAQNDLLAMPVDELLRELREDTGGTVRIPRLAYTDALDIVADDKAAVGRLESFAAAHGVVEADPGVLHLIGMIVAEAGVSAGMAHALVLASVWACNLATYTAATLERAGFDERLVLDLDEFFRS